MSGAPKQEPLSPEAVAFREELATLHNHCGSEPARFLARAARLFDAHRVNAHASLVAQIQRKDEALKAAGEKFRADQRNHFMLANNTCLPGEKWERRRADGFAKANECARMAEMCEAAQKGEA